MIFFLFFCARSLAFSLLFCSFIYPLASRRSLLFPHPFYSPDEPTHIAKYMYNMHPFTLFTLLGGLLGGSRKVSKHPFHHPYPPSSFYRCFYSLSIHPSIHPSISLLFLSTNVFIFYTSIHLPPFLSTYGSIATRPTKGTTPLIPPAAFCGNVDE